MVMIATITTAAIAATKDRNTNTKSRRCFLSSMVVVVAYFNFDWDWEVSSRQKTKKISPNWEIKKSWLYVSCCGRQEFITAEAEAAHNIYELYSIST